MTATFYDLIKEIPSKGCDYIIFSPDSLYLAVSSDLSF